jgi:hypothetical protein
MPPVAASRQILSLPGMAGVAVVAAAFMNSALHGLAANHYTQYQSDEGAANAYPCQ